MARSELLDALIAVESGGNNRAVSNKGARGIAQIMPASARDPGYGITPLRDNSPAEARRFANDYLDAMQKKFGSEKLAVAAYNAGPGSVQKYGDVPPFKETQNYVQKVFGMINPISTANASETPATSGKYADFLDAPDEPEAPAAKPVQAMPQASKYADFLDAPDDEPQATATMPTKPTEQKPGGIAGVTGRTIIEGVAGLPGDIYNTLSMISPENAAKKMHYGDKFEFPTVNTEQYGSRLADMLGLDKPNKDQEIPVKMGKTAIKVLGPAGLLKMIGAAPGLVSAVGGANPAITASSAAIGSGIGAKGREIAQSAGASEGTQTVVDLAGNILGGVGSGLAMNMARPIAQTGARTAAGIAGKVEPVAGRLLNRMAGSEQEANIVRQYLESGQVPNTVPVAGYSPTSSQIAGNPGISALARFVQNSNVAPTKLNDALFKNVQALDDYAYQGAVGNDSALAALKARLEAEPANITGPMRARNAPVDMTDIEKSLDDALIRHKGNPAIEASIEKVRGLIPRNAAGEPVAPFNEAYNFKQYVDDLLRGKYVDPESLQVAKSKFALQDAKSKFIDQLDAAEPGFRQFTEGQAKGLEQLNRADFARELLSKSKATVPLVSNQSGVQQEVFPLLAGKLEAALKNKAVMKELSADQRDALRNAARLAGSAGRIRAGMAVGSNTAQNLKMSQLISDDIARAMSGTDKSQAPGRLAQILHPLDKFLSDWTGRTEEMAAILARAELDPAYMANLMKKYQLSGPLNLKSQAGRNALYGALLGSQKEAK